MTTTDTTEKGLETLIMRYLTGTDGFEPANTPIGSGIAPYQGCGYTAGSPAQYDRAHALDTSQLFSFLLATQPDTVDRLALAIPYNATDINRLKFLDRLSSEIGKRGVIDILRKGIDHHPAGHFDMFYGTPSEDNLQAVERNTLNRFSVTRQLAYSLDQTRRALDICLFINGMPIATFELKNSLTKQTVQDAVEQYKRDRDPREKLFEFGRCVVHFAVDDSEVRMCAKLEGKASIFLPFNKGFKDGAGNPPNPDGLKVAYLWTDLLSPPALTDVLENYAQIVYEPDAETGKQKPNQMFPRYHQLQCVRKALLDVRANGVGKRYLIQHSAGSGKSSSIAWLAHQLIGVTQGGKDLFDSVIVLTDRRILDRQIDETIKQFMQVRATVGHADRSENLRAFIEQGKKIIVSTIQKFPFILDEISKLGGRSFAIIIDEAHSSQGGKTSAAVSKALGIAHEARESAPDSGIIADPEDNEDLINEAIDKRMRERKMLKNASYFAFTATPKPKTLEVFGDPLLPNAAGEIRHKPFDIYTMKQAIEEGFILDVLKFYTPINSYYRLIKTAEDDPEFDTRKAKKKLRRYVESHDHAIRLKAEIMVDHFRETVVLPGKIGGKARAMVVTSSIERAIQYYHAISGYLAETKSPYKAIAAFSGEPEFDGNKVTESSINGFPGIDIARKIQTEPYRFLICADKFQTGYDEPLLHTMYVDKPLSGIKAVQTLSRLNRARAQKHDCFVLDFQNSAETITEAFQDYYKTTLLSDETDPNRLNDLKLTLDSAQVYSPAQINELVALFLGGADRDRLDPILDGCVVTYMTTLDEDKQVDFKGKAKAFCRTYDFLASILPTNNRGWEKLSILLNLVIPKLPAPVEEDLARGILESIDMDSYRVEKLAVTKLVLADEDAEIEPIPTEGGGHKPVPEIDRLSNILKRFNEIFGTEFTDGDRVLRRIQDEIAPRVAADPAYMNAKANTPHTARIEHDRALGKAMQVFLKDDMQLYKLFVENDAFKRQLADAVFALTNH